MPRKRRRRNNQASKARKAERAKALGLLPIEPKTNVLYAGDAMAPKGLSMPAGNSWPTGKISGGGLYGNKGFSTKTSPMKGFSTKSDSFSKPAKVCKHWKQAVEVSEGITVHCSSYFDRPTTAWSYPEVGVFFDSSWGGSNNHVSKNWRGPNVGIRAEVAFMDWPDYGVPACATKMEKVLEYALNGAGNGRDVEIGCIGGHGRTGTALAAMRIMLGEHDADAAMQWVWDNYCVHAIESIVQEDWLTNLAARMYGTKPAARRAPAKAGKGTSNKRWALEASDDILDSIDAALITDADALSEDDWWAAVAAGEVKPSQDEAYTEWLRRNQQGSGDETIDINHVHVDDLCTWCDETLTQCTCDGFGQGWF